jgi:PAS domain S-box-containing protein
MDPEKLSAGAGLTGLVQSSPDAFILTDDAGRIVEFNAGAEAIFGWRREEVIGTSVGEIVVPERMRALHEAGMERVASGGPHHVLGRRVELPAIRKSGEEFPCEIALSSFEIGDERLFAAILRDLSFAHAALEEQRQAAAFLQSIFDDQTEVIFRFDADMRLNFVNDAASRLYGSTMQEMLGQHMFHDVEPDIRPRLKAELEALTPENPTIRSVDPKRLPWGDVKWFDWTNRALFDPEGRRIGFLSVGREVTEQMKEKAAREEAETRFRAFVRHAPIGMYLKDAEGRYTLVNPEMEHVFGRPAGEVLGLRARDLLPADVADIVEAADEQLLRSGRASAIEEFMEGADRYEWSLVVRFPVPGQDGTSPVIGGFDIDITPIKRAEAELARLRNSLAQTDKMNALGAFAASVVHELNNPLTILAGQAEMLAEEAAGGPLAVRAEMIERTVQRCGRIARSFLAVARRAPPQPVDIDVEELVDAAVEVAAHSLRSAGISLTRRYCGGLPTVRGDPDQIHQVLLNLLVNAQQAMSDLDGKRSLCIETRRGHDEAEAVIDVADEGPGVPKEIAHQIFDPFFTTKAGTGGTGLGLSISRDAIESLGGTLVLIPGCKGARFRITLPGISD